MMESSDHRDLNDVPMVGRLYRSRYRRVFSQREVGAAIVIIRKIVSKETAQVLLVENDHVIDAISTQGSDQAFHERIQVRRRLQSIRTVR